MSLTSRSGLPHCWGASESVVFNADSTLTYESGERGGLVYYVGDENWTTYTRLVFELAEPSPCGLRAKVLYNGETPIDENHVDAGATTVGVDMPVWKRGHVNQAVLQAYEPATLVIKRAYLVKEPDYGEQKGQLRINELMPSNVDCLMDELNEFPDSWVELYNSGPTPVNLVRYRIGLTANADSAWQLPSQTIVYPDSFVVVCCDKVGSGMHANFRLDSGKGASVRLFFDNEIADEVADLKKQPAPNTAYGRATESGDEWGYQYEPTPGAANCGTLCTEILGEPLFSEPGKVLTSSTTLQLQLSPAPHSPEGTIVRYTTDGREPTNISKAYTSPITIDSTMTIRAKAFCDGYLSPRSTTHSYIFLSREMTLPVISLVTDQCYWDDDQIGILANNGLNNRNDWRRPVNIEYFETADSESGLNQLSEMRVAGNTSRAHKLKSLVIYANKRFGNKRLNYEFFPDQRPGVADFKSLMLRNAGSDYYALYMRDAIIQRTMGTHADIDWQAWRPAIVFENGAYKGMLNIRERSNEDNVYTHHDHIEDIDMIENMGELKEGDLKNFNSFKAFYQEEGHTMAEYEQWIDCTEFTNWMLMELYFNNLDFPATNSMIWRPRSEGGRWRYIAKDTDLGLGGLSLPADYPILNWFYSPEYDPSHSWGQNRESATILFRHLMADEAFRQQFTDRAAVYMGDFLNEQGIRAIWDPMYECIKKEYVHHKKCLDDGRFSDYDYELGKARSWLSQRTNAFYQHLANFYNLGTPTPVAVNADMDACWPDGLKVTINGIPLTKATFNGRLFAGQKVTLEAECTDGLHIITGWKVEQQESDGSQTRNEVDGAAYSFIMPACERLSLQTVTGLSGIQTVTVSRKDDNAWYTLDGRRLTGSPAHNGLFIHHGQKAVVNLK